MIFKTRSRQARRSRVFFLAHKPGCNLWEDSCVLMQITAQLQVLQDIELRPLSSFFQEKFNAWNALPMRLWLVRELDEHYRARMKSLGNVVVPATGDLGWNLLHRLRALSQ